MPRAKSVLKTKELNPDYVRMYYEHQYDRIKAHEEQSLNISNIVLTITALIITFGLNNRQSFDSVFILILPIIIIIANIFAILNIVEGTKWMRQHQKRAKRALEVYAKELFAFDKEFPSPHKQWAVGRRRVQGVIHYSFLYLLYCWFFLFWRYSVFQLCRFCCINIGGVVARVESLRGRMVDSARQVEGLFESLLSEAFNA